MTTYNSLGLVESVIEPATSAHPALTDRTWITSYDANGNPGTETVPGGVTRARAFDALNRPTSETGAGAEATTTGTTFGYDLVGHRTTVNTPGGQITATYDDRGQPVTVASPAGGAADYTYDANDRVTARVDKAGTATFGWNANDRMVTATDPVTGTALSFTYDTGDRLTGVTSGGASGAQRTYSYDSVDRIITDQVNTGAGASLAATTYGYDADDHLTSKTISGTVGAGSNAYTYDMAGRLTSWTAPSASTTTYEWDAAGNRVQAGATGSSYDERNRLTAAGTSTYTYAARGTLAAQTVAATTTNLHYDALDRLITDGVTTYAYDGLSRLAQRTTSGTTTGHAYDAYSNNLVALTNAAGTPTARYGRTPDGQPLGIAENGGTGLAIANTHGDITATLNPDGTGLTGSTHYDPHGTVLARTGATPSLGYQGEYTDPASGRVNMHARWYTPGTGTFAGRDSMTLQPNPSIQANRYTYGNGEPLANTDPSGHFSLKPFQESTASSGASSIKNSRSRRRRPSPDGKNLGWQGLGRSNNWRNAHRRLRPCARRSSDGG